MDPYTRPSSLFQNGSKKCIRRWFFSQEEEVVGEGGVEEVVSVTQVGIKSVVLEMYIYLFG